MTEATNNQTAEPTAAPTETTPTQTAPVETTDMGLLGQSNSTTAKTDAAPADQNAPKVYADKYKTVEELEKAHKELEAKLGKGNAPDTYEVDPTIKEVGLTWKDDAQRDGVLKQFKEAGLSQKQADAVLRMYAESMKEVQATVAQYGPPPNAAQEMSAIQKSWGDEYETRSAALRQWLGTKPKDMWTRPPIATAAGAEMLYAQMIAERGPNFIKSVDTNGGGDANSIRVKRLEMMRDPKYGTSTPAGKQLEAEVNKLIEQELRLTGKG